MAAGWRSSQQRTAGRVCYASLLLLLLLIAALLIATSWIVSRLPICPIPTVTCPNALPKCQVVGVHEAALVYDSLHKTLRDDVLGPGRYFLGVSAVPPRLRHAHAHGGVHQLL